MTAPLLRLDSVSVRFPLGHRRYTDALTNVSLALAQGETLGLVGESGCGKSTLARTVMGAQKPSSGQIYFQGKPLDVSSHAKRLAYARQAQMVFQDPFSSLDPRMTVQHIVAENLEIHQRLSSAQRHKEVCSLLEMVGLPALSANRFPHEFSGGQRQRIGIARALAISPQLLVCDEPTSALDVSVQSQIIALLQSLRESKGLSYLFISHNLKVVSSLADHIAVMYKGAVVEYAEAGELCRNPLHPYTSVLFDAMLEVGPPRNLLQENHQPLEEAPQSSQGAGCAFAPRCSYACDICYNHQSAPLLREVGDGHYAACLLA